MKKRVSSILLAAVLCVTMLSVVALADECQHDWEYKDTGTGLNCIETCTKCSTTQGSSRQHRDDGLNNNAKDGKCDFCSAELAVSFNDLFRTICATTWEAAFKEIGSTSGTLYPIADTTETITYNGNGNVTINVTGKTLNNLTLNSGKVTLKHNEVYDGASTVKNVTVTGGTLKIEGNSHLTITNLNVSTGAKVELSGGTYGEITGADKETLLAPGYVFDGDTVKEAPIKSVTASVTGHNNAKYGYTAEQAPVLTAAITPAITPANVTGVTYQWYKVNGSKKTAIDNATAQTYTVETGLNAGYYDYCCTATVGTYSLTSEEVKVTIAKADGPQLGTINVNQVYNDTASKTININDYIGTDLNKLAKDAGTLRFHTGTYSPVDTIKSGWGVDVNTGAITYQLANGLSVNDEITITMQVGYNDQTYSKNHEDATVTVNITLTKITPTGTPNYTPITSSGKTLADAHLNADNAFSVPGTVKWVGETDELDPSTVSVEKDKAYTWKFTPQLDNYESITGSIILWTESGSGVVIITPSQSGESTPASNPNTGAAHVGQPLPGLALLALAALCLYAGTRRF